MKSLNARAFKIESMTGDMRLAFFHGPDRATASDLAQRLVKALLPPDDTQGPCVMAAETLAKDPPALAAEASATSMFGTRTVIHVDSVSDSHIEAIQLLLDTPAINNPVVMTGGQLRKGAKLLKLIESTPHILPVVCYEPDARDIKRLGQDMASALGLRPTRDASDLAAASAHGDRLILQREMEKYALYLDASPDAPKTLDASHILAIGANAPDENIDALINAVFDGNAAYLAYAFEQLDGNNQGIMLLRQAVRRAWLLLQLHQALASGRSTRQAIDEARPPIFWKMKDKIEAQLIKWHTDTLTQAMRHLLDAECGIKQSGSAGDILARHTLFTLAMRPMRAA